jgi:hypothetical protein
MLMNLMRNLVLSFLLLFLFVISTNAQMFSIKSKPKAEAEAESRVDFQVGSRLSAFDFNGETNANPFFTFNDPTYYLEANFGGVLLNLDYGRNLGNSNDLNFIRFGIQFQSEYKLYRNSWFQGIIPLYLSTDSFTLSAQRVAQGISNRYEQTGFSFGSGIIMRLKVLKEHRFDLNQQAHYGYAARGLGGSSGSRTFYHSKISYISPKFINQARLILSAGYRMQEFDLDTQLYDYTLRGFEFGLGVSF